MDEKKFEELLLKNNDNLIQKMDTKFEDMLIKNNETLMKKMDEKIDKALIKNNEALMQKMDEKIDEKIDKALSKNNEVLMKKIKKEINLEIIESEKRQNSKLAYLEYTYGEKISAIFDKIQSMEEIMIRNEKENQKYREVVDHHSDILYSHDFRISNIEKKVSSN